MKVHITLVGGQPAPVYHGIVATQPDKVVFIYSVESQYVVEAVRREIKMGVDKQEPLDATNPQKILERVETLAEKYKNDEITLNISGGTKAWTVLFGRVFDKMPNAEVVYMDQNNVLWNYRTMQSKTDFEFDMDVLFRMQNNALTHYTPFSDYTEEDKKTMDCLIRARKSNYKTFNELTTILSKEWDRKLAEKRGQLVLSDNNYVEWEKPDFVRLTMFTKREGVQVFEMESPNAVRMAFHAGWFEYKVARMLSHWRYAKDIRLNCLFPEKAKANPLTKNEIDIIVNTGTKILFVECKTQISSSNDIDKFRTAIKNYGGMSSKALFITDSVKNDMQKEKCQESGIISFSLQDTTIGPNKEQELFELLEKELFNINTK